MRPLSLEWLVLFGGAYAKNLGWFLNRIRLAAMRKSMKLNSGFSKGRSRRENSESVSPDLEAEFSQATRKLLFREQPKVSAPKAIKSAAERPERHVRVKVTMNIDGDTIAFFKARAKEDGRPYQTLMNQVLKDFVSGSRPERLAEEVAQLLMSDEGFLEALGERVDGGKVGK